MLLLKKTREKRINKIMDAIYKKNIIKRYFMLLLGCFIVALAFNLCFLSYIVFLFRSRGCKKSNSWCFNISGFY